MKILFTVPRTGQTGVRWCPSKIKKGIPVGGTKCLGIALHQYYPVYWQP
jgi:hypothetical protein